MHSTPLATYRLQLHRGFTFDDAIAQLDYLAGLGISHVYASPITTAQPGSSHGYDMADPTHVSAELGGEEGLQRFVAVLRRHHMGLIADIVPNHMGVGGPGNPWWQDVLACGEASRYAGYFDIDWQTSVPGLQGKVMLPCLGQEYGDALAAGEFTLDFDAATHRLVIRYFDQQFPVNVCGHSAVLRAAKLPVADIIQTRLAALQAATDPVAQAALNAQLDQDIALALTGPDSGDTWPHIQHMFDPKNASGSTLLHALLENQHYRLAPWTAANDEVNWRRFFDVSTLAGLRVEQGDVFEAVHALTFRLFANGLIDGVRVDHIDGLADPAAYCHRLRERLTALLPLRPTEVALDRPWIIIEKILGTGETLHEDWQVDGTTGYDFMNEVSAVLHRQTGGEALQAAWQQWAGEGLGDYAAVALAARRKILTEHFSSELDTCCHAFLDLAKHDLHNRSMTFHAIRRVVIELVVHFPVYRVYDPTAAADRAHFAVAYQGAWQALREVDQPVLEMVRSWLGFDEGSTSTQTTQPDALCSLARRRFLQLTSPVAAKSIEDTAFYRYGALLSRNEVGSDPAQVALSVADFHQSALARQTHFPHALLATATHDHKRGEDIRARLAVLTEIPQLWIQTVERWHRLNNEGRTADNVAPNRAFEAILYQSLVGAWPAALTADDAEGIAHFAQRISARQLKALREAKLNTDWLHPNLAHEAACEQFLQSLLQPESPFLVELVQFVGSISSAGAVNAITQCILKLTSPGVPDIYQGTEFWDGSLVDPDNRSEVDFAARLAALEALIMDASNPSISALLADWQTGHIKQVVIQRLLQLRNMLPALFLDGSYQALEVQGSSAEHVIAFLRQRDLDTVMVIVPRWPMQLLAGQTLQSAKIDWHNTALTIPPQLHQATWRNVLSGEAVSLADDEWLLHKIAQPLPWAVLHLDHRTQPAAAGTVVNV